MSPPHHVVQVSSDRSYSMEGLYEGNGSDCRSATAALAARLHASAAAALYRALRCPGCTAYLFPPVCLCAQGHSLCVECAVEASCPLCRRPLLSVRNAALEDAARAALAPCAHRGAGCDVVLPPLEAAAHGRRCPHRSLPCPMSWPPSCSWRGRGAELVAHVSQEHPMHVARSGDLELDLFPAAPANFGVLFSCGERFLARARLVSGFDADSKKFSTALVAVHYLGARRPPADFVYEASVTVFLDDDDDDDGAGERRRRRRIAGRRRVHGGDTDAIELFAKKECVALNLRGAKLLPQQVIILRIRIEEEA